VTLSLASKRPSFTAVPKIVEIILYNHGDKYIRNIQILSLFPAFRKAGEIVAGSEFNIKNLFQNLLLFCCKCNFPVFSPAFGSRTLHSYCLLTI
jgi:hypothetical protein